MPKRPEPRLVLVAVGLVAVLGLALLISQVGPWALWADLRAHVRAETGLELTSAEGPSLTLFPGPGVTLAGVTLGDPAPGGSPLVTCARVEVRPRLLPLFLGRLELDLIRLGGLRLDLSRADPGRRPRELVPVPAEPTVGPAAPEAARLADPSAATPAQVALAEHTATLLRGARVEVIHSAVTWGDRAAGAALADLSFHAGPIDPGIPLALRLTGRVAPGLGSHQSARVSVTAKLVPGDWVSLTLGDVRVLIDDPVDLAVEPLELTGSIGLGLPQESDPRLAVRIDLVADRLDLWPAQALGPDPAGQDPATKVVSAAAGPGADAPPARSPSPAPEPAPQPTASPESSQPSAWLRDMDISGTLSVQHLRVAGLRLDQVSVQVRGSGGDLYLDHRAAEFYGGRLAGTLHLDLQGQDPQIDLAGAALGFQVAPLLTDITGAAALSGRGELNLKLTTVGPDRYALVRGLGGSLVLALRDGGLRGLDLSPLVAAAGLHPQGGQSQSFAAFTVLSASAALAKGVLRSDDLIATGPGMRLTGRGTLDLMDGGLDWRLAPILTASPQGGGIKELEGVPIPVFLGGTLGDPIWRVDIAAVLSEVARRRLGERSGDVIERLERRTGVKGLDGVLRGLLGR